MSDLLNGVETWTEYLKNRPLPVRNSVLRRLQRQLRDDNIPLQRIKQTIKSDPVLCLHMVRKASELHQQKNSTVTSIDHAISSLGLTMIEEIMQEATPLKLNPSSVAQKMYFRQIAISHHAATQASQWLSSRNAPFVDETYLATIFYGVGHWMLWQHAPLHMSEIETQIREQDVDALTAEANVLGCTIQDISKHIVESWGISELAVTSLDHENSPDRRMLTQLHQRALGDPRITPEDLRDINHLVQEKFFPVKLANWLALAANYGWQVTRTMKVIDIINDYLKAEIADTIAMLHRNCVQSSQQYHVAGTLSPAAEMLMLPSELQVNYKLSSKEGELLKDSVPSLTPPAAEAKTAEPSKVVDTFAYADKDLFDQVSTRFLKGYAHYTQPKHILQGLIHAVNQGLGFNRTAIFVINHQKQQLKTGIHIGFGSGHPIADYKTPLNKPSLLSKLLEKPACIWVKPDNMDSMIALLPKSYHNLIDREGFMLMSVFAGKNPLAIMHVDFADSDQTLTDKHHEQFRLICNAASLALKKLKQA